MRKHSSHVRILHRFIFGHLPCVRSSYHKRMKHYSVTALLLTIAIILVANPAVSQSLPRGLDRSCIASSESDEGEWIASRDIVEVDGIVNPSRDSFRWEPRDKIAFGPGGMMDWTMSYRWPTSVGKQSAIAERDVMVLIFFSIKPQDGQEPLRNPQRSLLHLYRATDPSREFSFVDTSMINVMFWHQYRDGQLQTKAVIPLDHLLAFGHGHDQLVWNIRSEPSPVSGGTFSLANGVLPIAMMRGKIAAIPKLRRMLDKKAVNFRKECDVIRMAPMSQ
jgi:hypothetical protein